MTGAILSLTVMVWLVDEELPQTSVAFQVRVIVYLCVQVWLEITSVTTTLTAPVQLSVALTLEILATGTFSAHAKVAGPGVPVITGATLSLTVMVWLVDEELPQTSVAFQVRVIVYLCVQV